MFELLYWLCVLHHKEKETAAMQTIAKKMQECVTLKNENFKLVQELQNLEREHNEVLINQIKNLKELKVCFLFCFFSKHTLK